MIFTAYDFYRIWFFLPHMILAKSPADLRGLPLVQMISNLVLEGLSMVYIDIHGWFAVKLRRTWDDPTAYDFYRIWFLPHMIFFTAYDFGQESGRPLGTTTGSNDLKLGTRGFEYGLHWYSWLFCGETSSNLRWPYRIWFLPHMILPHMIFFTAYDFGQESGRPLGTPTGSNDLKLGTRGFEYGLHWY